MSYASEQGILNAQWNAAELACRAEESRIRPSVLRRAKVFRDGDKWCCSLFWPKELSMMEQLVTFGDTPEDACKAFDKAWLEGEKK